MTKYPPRSGRLPPGGYAKLMQQNNGLAFHYANKYRWAMNAYGKEDVESAMRVALLISLQAWVHAKPGDERNLNGWMMFEARSELMHLRLENMHFKIPCRRNHDREFISKMPKVTSLDSLIATETDHGDEDEDRDLPVAMMTGRDPVFDSCLRWQRFDHFTPLQQEIIAHKLTGENDCQIAAALGLSNNYAVGYQSRKMKAQLAA